MEQGYTYNQSNETQTNLSLRKLLIIVIGLIILLATLYLIFSYGLVRVTVTGEGSGNVSLSQKEFSDSPTRASKSLGSIELGSSRLYLLRRGTYEFAATTQNAGSSQTLGVSMLKINNLDLEIKQQKSLRKIGNNGLGCSTVVNNTMYSYSCGGESGIFRHKNLSSNSFSDKESISAEAKKKKVARNYQDGLLVIEEIEGADGGINSVRYINLSNNQSSLVDIPIKYFESTPEGISTVSNIVVDQSFSSTSFGLILFDSSILIYKDAADTSPREIKPDFKSSGVEANELAKHYRLTGSSLILFAAREDTSEDSETEFELNKAYKEGFVEEYDLSSNSPRIKQRITLSKDITGSSGTIFGDNQFVVQTKSGLRVFTVISGKIRKETLKTPSQNYAVTKDNKTLLIGSDQTIYSFTAPYKQMHLTFSSPVFNFSNFSLSKDSILVEGISRLNEKRTETQTYTLDLQKNSSVGDLEKKLPYNTKGLPIAEMDFLDRLIVIRPILNSISYVDGPEYDENEFQTVTKKILASLEKDGITKSNSNIIFLP